MSKPPCPMARRAMDPELSAMAKIDRLLADLPQRATIRVIDWLLAKYAAPKTMLCPPIDGGLAAAREQIANREHGT